jgi:hypothetical protein
LRNCKYLILEDLKIVFRQTAVVRKVKRDNDIKQILLITKYKNMTNWTKNNRACTTLWTTLYNMKQLQSNFEVSGQLKMQDLTFYNVLSSSDLRNQEAKIIADQLDNIFRIGRGAKYESGVTRSDAMIAMVEILTDDSKLVEELATKIDNQYLFWGE